MDRVHLAAEGTRVAGRGVVHVPRGRGSQREAPEGAGVPLPDTSVPQRLPRLAGRVWEEGQLGRHGLAPSLPQMVDGAGGARVAGDASPGPPR